MKRIITFCISFCILFCQAQKTDNLNKPAAKTIYSGNPVFPGWYADPEVRIFNHLYWVYPTWSDVYNQQVFLDAFSSPDLVHWKKHSRIVDTSRIKWAKRAMWAPSTIEKNGKYYL